MMLSQLRFAGAIAAVLLIQVVAADTPVAVPDGQFLIALLAVPIVTVVVTVVPWEAVDHRWHLVVPLVDLAAVELLRLAAPQAGFGILLAFPVVWLTLSFGRIGAWAGVLTATTIVLGQLLLQMTTSVVPGPPPVASTAIGLTVTIIFLAAATSASQRRIGAQQRLLAGQADLLEDARQRVVDEQLGLTAVLDKIEFVVLTYDKTGRPLHANDTALRVLAQFGIRPGTPAGHLPMYAADGITPSAVQDLIDRALQGESVPPTTYWLGHPGHERTALEVRVDPLSLHRGSQGSVLVVGRDVTAEIALAQALDESAASASHELRTPLSSVLGYLDLVRDDPTTTPEARGHLEIAVRNTERLLHLVDDLLSSRSTSAAPHTDLALDDVDVSAIVRESVESQQPRAAERLVTLRTESTGPTQLRADPLRLRQVFDNVVSNAVKYDRPGGEVVACVESLPDRVVTTITDTGPGIAPEELDLLFSRYYRTVDARSSTAPGTGLGLAIARDIVESHGGTLDLQSRVGTGTTVTVSLPRDPEAGGAA